jgi:hypothetical protein
MRLTIILGSLSWFLGGLCFGWAGARIRQRHNAGVPSRALQGDDASAVIHPLLRTARAAVVPEHASTAPAAIEATEVEARRATR